MNDPTNPTYWVSGVAVYSPAAYGTGGGGTCWYAVHRFEAPMTDQAQDLHLVADLPADNGASRTQFCRGDIAAHIDVDVPAPTSGTPRAGTSWARPLQLTQADLTRAALSAGADTTSDSVIESGSDIS